MRKFQSQKWQLFAASIMMTVCTSCFTMPPAWAAEYNNPLTGVVKDDKAIIKADGNTVRLDKSTNTVTYDFKGQDHTFNVKNNDGISTNGEGNNYDYVYNNVGEDGSKGTLHIYQVNSLWNPWSGVNGFAANGGTTIINSNLDITATSDYASVGVTAGGAGKLIINGNVKMRKDDPSNPWGIITKNVHGNIGPGGATSMDPTDVNYTGARWQPSAFAVGYTRGHITVNGDVDVAVRGTAVNVGAYSAAKGVHAYNLASISLVGNSIKIETPSDERKEDGSFKEAYYSLASYGGTVNINVRDANNNQDMSSIANERLEAVEGNTTNLIGNVIALKRSERTDKPDVY